MPDDRELLERARYGDAEAWKALLDLHGPFALGLAESALRRTGAEGILPEDLVQEAWTGLLSGGWAHIEDLRSYLAATLLNAARRHRRSSARRRTREMAAPQRPEGEPADALLLRAERAEEMEEALSSLEPGDGLLLRWAYWDGLSYGEIARLAGLGENSVGPALSRSRDRFREALDRKKAARGGAGAGSLPG